MKIKQSFALISVVVFLVISTLIANEIFKQQTYQILLTTKEKAYTDIVLKARKKKQEIINLGIDCQNETKYEDERYTIISRFDYTTYKNCGNQNSINFLHTTGFTTVDLYIFDKIYNLSFYERFYKK